MIFASMGTMVSVTGNAPIEPIFADADARFSLYRPDSEASRIARGELSLVDASPTFRAVYALANDWRLATDGAFTSHRPDGVVDLSGIVKAWTMAAASDLLGDDWCLNVGGDVATRGRSADGSPWSVGIVDPFDRGRLLTALSLDASRDAVATSGSAERGDHIWKLGDPAAAGFVQVTVIAPDIVMADVLATAIVSAGPAGLDDITASWPIDVLAVHDDGTLLATPGMREAIAGASASV